LAVTVERHPRCRCTGPWSRSAPTRSAIRFWAAVRSGPAGRGAR
jgi:hypothetical protein